MDIKKQKNSFLFAFVLLLFALLIVGYYFLWTKMTRVESSLHGALEQKDDVVNLSDKDDIRDLKNILKTSDSSQFDSRPKHEPKNYFVENNNLQKRNPDGSSTVILKNLSEVAGLGEEFGPIMEQWSMGVYAEPEGSDLVILKDSFPGEYAGELWQYDPQTGKLEKMQIYAYGHLAPNGKYFAKVSEDAKSFIITDLVTKKEFEIGKLPADYTYASGYSALDDSPWVQFDWANYSSLRVSVYIDDNFSLFPIFIQRHPVANGELPFSPTK